MTSSDPESPSGVEISVDMLSPESLRAMIEEFVTRDGTDYGDVESDVEERIAQVMAQLASREASIVFDPDTETTNIVVTRDLREGDGT